MAFGLRRVQQAARLAESEFLDTVCVDGVDAHLPSPRDRDNPLDRSALEPSGADRKAVARVGGPG